LRRAVISLLAVGILLASTFSVFTPKVKAFEEPPHWSWSFSGSDATPTPIVFFMPPFEAVRRLIITEYLNSPVNPYPGISGTIQVHYGIDVLTYEGWVKLIEVTGGGQLPPGEAFSEFGTILDVSGDEIQWIIPGDRDNARLWVYGAQVLYPDDVHLISWTIGFQLWFQQPERAPSAISIDVSPTSIKKGESVTVSGAITPAHIADVTLIYTRPDTSVDTRIVASSSDGTYSDTYTPDVIGNWSIQASWYGDTDHDGAVSSIIAFEVTASDWKDLLQVGDILYDPDFLLGLAGHTGIYVGSNQVIEAQPNGVIGRGIETWDYPARSHVYILRVVGGDEQQAVHWAAGQLLKPYDWKYWQKNSDPNSPSWYCHELVWAAYLSQGINIERTPDSLGIRGDEIFNDETGEADDDVYVVGGHEEGRIREGFFVISRSPVDLIVTDPDGLTIRKESNEIPGYVAYLEDDFNEDGSTEDAIFTSEPKIGNYLITVVPEPNALPTDTYTLEVSGPDTTIILAQNVPISNIPVEPYVIRWTTAGIAEGTPPTTTLTIGSPQYTDIAGNVYITSETSLTLLATDDLSGSGVASTAYKIRNATYDTGWITYVTPLYLTGLADGTYFIDYNSTDNVGNMESPNTQEVILDNTSPATTLTIGEPKYTDDTTYVTLDTPFTLEATDTGSGIYSTTYRIYNATYDSGWLAYTTPFRLTSLTDGAYTIECNSTDNVKNMESTHAVNVTLFSWNYIYQDAYGRGTTLKINLAHKFIQFITVDKDYGMRKATYMKQSGRAIIIEHYDKQLSLITIAVDTKLDFCCAIAWDLQTYKLYLLIDKVGME